VLLASWVTAAMIGHQVRQPTIFPARFPSLEDLGFVPRGEAGRSIAKRNTAPAKISGAKISVCYGVGGMFAASRTIMVSNE
jgi:hypothetical protein